MLELRIRLVFLINFVNFLKMQACSGKNLPDAIVEMVRPHGCLQGDPYQQNCMEWFKIRPGKQGMLRQGPDGFADYYLFYFH
ncbi:hypothetical protein BKE30_01115 [Alkanindiges hydrocarboniclasticus]|uniref:Uncharacterized protein n=1 Tax=Alkanindiges hydrocarboniclasticus TaxID=1907941 RepID=A0A1S8CXR4_9GAMM|nr:hypothetical protein BKE30_01115 [Alkanindiges hydrocarboniclasticus]